MNRILKFKDPNINYYFGSDFHLNHNPKWDVPIWKDRGYNSVHEMNQDIINKVNAKVREDDVLFHMGDFSLNCTSEEFHSFINQIVCKNIYFLWGNHNSPSWKVYQDAIESEPGENDVEVYPMRYANLIFVGNYLECFVHGQRITMSHYSYRIFNKSHKGAWNLSGHSHFKDKYCWPTNLNSKNLDLGWEGKNDIYSFQELQKIMAKKTVLNAGDHHDENCN